MEASKFSVTWAWCLDFHCGQSYFGCHWIEQRLLSCLGEKVSQNLHAWYCLVPWFSCLITGIQCHLRCPQWFGKYDPPAAGAHVLLEEQLEAGGTLMGVFFHFCAWAFQQKYWTLKFHWKPARMQTFKSVFCFQDLMHNCEWLSWLWEYWVRN